jgi:tetratricopeptide (TPR) repeat protein
VTGRLLAAMVVAVVATARDASADDTVAVAPVILDEIRTLIADGRFAEARDKMLQLYQLTPEPRLLFALGQLEFNLENYAAAIRYYEQFLDSNPPAEQASLAQQGIGASRVKLAAIAAIEPEKPPPQHVRDWDVWSTVLVSIGGATLATGAGIFAYGSNLGGKPTTSLSAYDAQYDRARELQWIGGAVAAGGAVITTIALVRFAIRRVEIAPIQPGPSMGAVGLAVTGRW